MNEKTSIEIWHILLRFRDDNIRSSYVLVLAETFKLLEQYEHDDNFVGVTINKTWVPNDSLGHYLKNGQADVQ